MADAVAAAAECGEIADEIERLRADLRYAFAWMDKQTFREFRADPDGARIVAAVNAEQENDR